MANKSQGLFVFVEIKDHEKVLEGSLEILTKARELKGKIGEKIYAIVFGLDVHQYLPTIEQYGPDVIIFSNSEDKTLKHYNEEIFTDMWEDLIQAYSPSIVLLPSTEAGSDLAPRLAQRFSTGLTAHCSDIDIADIENYGENLLLMKRPAFSGDMIASIICPETRPQMATIQQGVFKKEALSENEVKNKKIEKIEVECKHILSKLKIVNVCEPSRWNRESIPLERAPIIISGGNGLGSKEKFEKLFVLANLLEGEVGTTRIPVFKEWCSSERMIGQTGKIIKPELYMGFGVSGQIHHSASITDSKRIVSINTDPDANLNNIADYVIIEDVNQFLPKLIERIKEEKKTFNEC